MEQNQSGWARALPKVHFNIMNTMNTSTQVSPFVLKMGRSPRLLPPVFGREEEVEEEVREEAEQAKELIEKLSGEVEGVKDCLLAVKISQVHHVNKHMTVDPAFAIGDKVMLETVHQRRDYMQKKSRRVVKFMP